MFRRLIVWLGNKKDTVLWRGELLRTFPSKEALDKALAERAVREQEILTTVACKSYRQGYEEGWAKGHIEGFEHCAKAANRVFREEFHRDLDESRIRVTH